MVFSQGGVLPIQKITATGKKPSSASLCGSRREHRIRIYLDVFFFFFQAEDGIRDYKVTGVQTCALPISFMTSPSADVYRVVTKDGYEIKATEWHDFYTTRGKIKLKDLKVGDELLVQSGKGQFGGSGSEELGVLLGLITGDGHFTNRGEGKNSAGGNLWGEDRDYAHKGVTQINSLITGWANKRPP